MPRRGLATKPQSARGRKLLAILTKEAGSLSRAARKSDVNYNTMKKLVLNEPPPNVAATTVAAIRTAFPSVPLKLLAPGLAAV